MKGEWPEKVERPSRAKAYRTLRWFECGHLPDRQRQIAAMFQSLALHMTTALNDSPDQAEVNAGLRKLLEAKDCFVRASIDPEER